MLRACRVLQCRRWHRSRWELSDMPRYPRLPPAPWCRCWVANTSYLPRRVQISPLDRERLAIPAWWLLCRTLVRSLAWRTYPTDRQLGPVSALDKVHLRHLLPGQSGTSSPGTSDAIRRIEMLWACEICFWHSLLAPQMRTVPDLRGDRSDGESHRRSPSLCTALCESPQPCCRRR